MQRAAPSLVFTVLGVLGASTSTFPQDCLEPPSGLVSWWDGFGDTNDILGTNPATPFGGVSFASAKVDQGFDLDGTGRLEAPDSPSLDITGPMTVEAWVSFTGVRTVLPPVVAKWGETSAGTAGYGLFVDAGGTPSFIVSPNGTLRVLATSTSPLPVGIFAHVAGVFTGAGLELYVDGALHASTPFTGSIHSNDAPLLIGGYDPSLTSFEDGVIGGIDEVAIYNRALSQAEIAAIYSAGSAGKCKDSDGDALYDSEEIALGTDPLDPDTDNDGLLDGTEVDTAGGSDCPDPLNPDSDGDMLLDGDEVDPPAGTTDSDPCKSDTDDDGIPDNLDPFPRAPEGTDDFIAQELRALSDYIVGVDLDLFTGPNGNANKGRANALSNRANAAANQVNAGNFTEAADDLHSLVDRVDGADVPKDWMEPSEERETISAWTEELLDLLEYLE